MEDFKYDLKNNINSTKEKVQENAVYQCYKEMYANAQPPVDYDKLVELAKAGKEDHKHPFYTQHYLTTEEYQYIKEKYIDAYGMREQFTDHCDVILRYFDEGTIDKYVERDGDSPGYRSYEDLPPLKDLIGEEHYNIVVNRVKQAQGFYRFNRDESAFNWAMMYSSPTSNKQQVIDYWKSQGIDITIDDKFRKNDSYLFDRYYFGEEADDDSYYNLDLIEKIEDDIDE